MEKEIKYSKLQLVDSIYYIADVNLPKGERKNSKRIVQEIIMHAVELKEQAVNRQG